MDSLISKGIDEESLKKVYAPIGLKISGETPEEIAISILAEILLVKNQGELIHMVDTLK
jgi:xanthine dehydrogenase accessory factor